MKKYEYVDVSVLDLNVQDVYVKENPFDCIKISSITKSKPGKTGRKKVFLMGVSFFTGIKVENIYYFELSIRKLYFQADSYELIDVDSSLELTFVLWDEKVSEAKMITPLKNDLTDEIIQEYNQLKYQYFYHFIIIKMIELEMNTVILSYEKIRQNPLNFIHQGKDIFFSFK